MLRLSLLTLLLAAGSVSHAGAATQSFYFHYSSGGAAIPPGSDPHHYMDTAVPTATTPIVTDPMSVPRDETRYLPTFTSTPVGTSSLERRVIITANLSANGPMNSCAVISGTLERVQPGGNTVALGIAPETTTSIPQGSGGGLQGYAPIPISFEMDVDRTISPSDSIRVIIAVKNSCASNRSVRLIFDGTPAVPNEHSRAQFDTPDITVYGAPATFGKYRHLVSSTAKLARSSVADWRLDLGETLFLSTVAPSDGTLFVGNFYKTQNSFLSTSCSTVVTCFNPNTKTCPTNESAGGAFFANIRVPDSGGALFSPSSASETTCAVPELLPPFNIPATDAAVGGDIADVEYIDGIDERIQFTSSRGTGFYSPIPPSGNDMAIGKLTKSSGIWGISEIQFPATANANCPSGDCQFLNELAQLPGSGHIVYTQYFNATGDGIIFVTDRDGALQAWTNLPNALFDANASVCNLGTGPQAIGVTAKTIEIDPSSAASCGLSGCTDERFAIEYDTYTDGVPRVPRSYSFQEFRYNSTTIPPTIEPVTPALFVTSPPASPNQLGSAPCGTKGGNPPHQALGVYYDHQGNLWANRATTVVDVFMRDPATGLRRIETDPACRWLGHENQWGVTCAADLEFAVNEGSAGWVDDPITGNVLFVSRYGRLFRFSPAETSAGEPTFSAKTTPLNLSIDAALPPVTTFGAYRYMWRPSFDVMRRIAWVPTTVVAPHANNTPIQHWVFAIDVPAVMSYP